MLCFFCFFFKLAQTSTHTLTTKFKITRSVINFINLQLLQQKPCKTQKTSLHILQVDFYFLSFILDQPTINTFQELTNRSQHLFFPNLYYERKKNVSEIDATCNLIAPENPAGSAWFNLLTQLLSYEKRSQKRCRECGQLIIQITR